jgi:hypothetical protein
VAFRRACCGLLGHWGTRIRVEAPDPPGEAMRDQSGRGRVRWPDTAATARGKPTSTAEARSRSKQAGKAPALASRPRVELSDPHTISKVATTARSELRQGGQLGDNGRAGPAGKTIADQ